MKLSPVEEYGLRCLMVLAKSGDAHPTTIRTISESEGLSTAYVGKLMFLLQKAHLVVATRGVQGGYVLVKKPAELHLSEIFHALDPQELDDICEKFTGTEQLCVHMSSCTIKQVLSGLTEHMNSFLQKYTLADMVGQASNQGATRG